MNKILEKKAKKRKHAVADIGLVAEPSTKRAKKDKTKRDKGKTRATDDGSEFRVIQATMSVSIPPVFANNLRKGVEEMLDSLLMRYIPALQGVMLAHDELSFLDSMATIKADCPFANCRVAFNTTVWSPQIGMKLVGKVNLCSPGHVALLLRRTFNVSIPRHHIPEDQWEFEYGPAENDPEFGAAIADEKTGTQDGETEQVGGNGRWVHKLTGVRLGDSHGFLEFTVVGLTIANRMLSLVGSIQPDPFSPEHVPRQTVAATTDVRDEPGVDEFHPVEEINEDDGSEVDTFELLGRMGDQAKAREAELRKQEEKEAKRDQRRRRKEAKGGEGAGGVDAGGRKGKKKKKA
ncbi:uncharacterized protein LAESUDRAFT_721116 [Laetiporus sulphureus 93-53]|uniref:RPA43 OB domain-containing protein n=1 Tax=Laetiporus sulphureus 93-53 TaxID=1314785 RepID=A0A165GSH2_9APHY|nr:uncharacterized protein LAESUDRAFT_721116 [Laetiporus sulphureus 93-53]KZT10747.1 hypothetical protein LAESUDRAFT_721116 [Laetiporus sulphureus 93-53]